MRGRANNAQRGVVLVVVLWLLVLLAVLVTSQAKSARIEGELVRNQVDALYARTAAEAGLFTMIDMLAREQAKDEWTLRTDGTPYHMEYQGVELEVSVLDEAGKIDLNAVRPEMLRKLLVSLSGEMEKGIAISDAILDWRDADHQRRESGAEDDEYREHDRAYGAKDEYLDNIEELLLVLGMDGQLYAKLMSIVTVSTGTQGINPAVAQRLVLLAIPGITAEQIDAYLLARERYYTDGGVFPAFPLHDGNYISQNRNQLYSIHVQARTQGGTSERIAAVTRVSAKSTRDGGRPYEILRWNANDHFVAQQSQ